MVSKNKMKMKNILLFLLFLEFIPSFSQEKEVLILNLKNKKAIQYANIKFLNSRKGTFSDENGFFVYDKKNLDSVLVSVLGYNNKTLWSKNINDTIYLSPKIISLDEITLSNNKNDYGYFKKKSKFIRSKLKRIIIAMFMPNNNPNKKEYITTLYYRIKKYGNEKSIVRPHLLSVNKENGNPNKELLNKNIVINVNDKNNILSVDISKVKIKFPPEGIFVALEWVGNTTDVGFGYSNLKDNTGSYALLTSLEFEKKLWIPLTPIKEKKTIAHFGISVK